MIDYAEELKKFEPCLDVTDAAGAIYDHELTDILDVLQEMLREAKEAGVVGAYLGNVLMWNWDNEEKLFAMIRGFEEVAAQ